MKASVTEAGGACHHRGSPRHCREISCRMSCVCTPILHALQRKLCADFHINSYPTLTFGSADQYISRSNVTEHPSNEDRSAASMVAWVGRQMGRWGMWMRERQMARQGVGGGGCVLG